MFDANPLSNLEEGPGLGLKAGFDDGLQGGNFTVIDRRGRLAHSHNQQYARRDQYGDSTVNVETTKYVAREEREVHLFDAV